jgi:hypothetical protein
MKIIVSSSNKITHINNNRSSLVSEVSQQDTALLPGMGKAYQKLKSRIQREGLFSLGFSGYAECRTEHGFLSLNRN